MSKTSLLHIKMQSKKMKEKTGKDDGETNCQVYAGEEDEVLAPPPSEKSSSEIEQIFKTQDAKNKENEEELQED